MRDSVRLEETGYASAVRGLLLVLGFCCAFLAQARTTYYLWQSESSKSYLAITNETYWSTTGKSTGTVPAAIDETGDFVVNGGKWLRSQASKVEAQTFTGHSLTITNGVLYNYDAAGTFTMTGEGGLTFWNGRLNVNRKSANSTTSIKSDVYIKGTNNFFYQSGDKYNLTIMIPSGYSFSSDADAVLNVGGHKSSNASAATGFKFRIEGDCSAYYGTLEMATKGDVVKKALEVANGTQIPGTVIMGTNTILAVQTAGSKATFGSLVLKNSSQINVIGKGDGYLVTDAFSCEGGVSVRIMNDPSSWIPSRQALLTVPSDSRLEKIDFTLTNTYAEKAVLKVVDDGTHKILYVVYPETVTLDTADDGEMKNYGKTSALSPGHGYQWSDTKEPHDLAIYSVGKALRTPQDTTDEPIDYVFPGEVLKLTGGILMPACRSFEADIVVSSSSQINSVNSYNYHYLIKGDILLNASLTSYTMNSATTEIAAEIHGTGNFNIGGIGSTSAPQGSTRLSGINTNWFGKTTMTQNSGTSGGAAYPSLARYQTLGIADERSLGGKLEAFAFDALKLKNYSCLAALNSLVLSEEWNRGICVDGVGQITVPLDATLTCRRTLTVRGTLHKTGPGTLVLGGGLKFLDSSGALTDEPGADTTNGLVIANGQVKVVDFGSVDGVRVRTASSTGSIVLDFNPEDENLRRYGIRNVKTDCPFDTRYDVRLAMTGVDAEVIDAARKTDAGFKQGLLTVRTSAADAVRAKLKFDVPPRTQIIREDDPQTGLTTFSLYGKDTGMILIFR